jgi:hypothetical protein
MEIREYDPESWSLIFFRQYTSGEGVVRFPSNPADVLHYKTPLVLARLNNGLVDAVEWPVSSAPALLLALAEANSHPMTGDVSVLYSLHPKSLVERMAHWAKLMTGEPLDNLGGRAIHNLVELFHGPAILTLDDRNNFNSRLVEEWAGIDPGEEGETSTLLQLCRKLRSP